MTASEQLLVAQQGLNKSAFSDTMANTSENWSEPAWKAIKGIGNFGSYFIPGVGSARMGYDAYNALREGRPWAAAGNAIGALVGLIPEVGGGLGKGIATGMELLGKSDRLVGALPSAGKFLKTAPGALRAGENALSGGIAKIPGVSHFVNSKPGQWMNENPFKTMTIAGTGIPGVGFKPALEKAQTASDLGKQMAGGPGFRGAAAGSGTSNFMPSARSLLGMAGFGGGEMDPRYIGSPRFDYNTGQPA